MASVEAERAAPSEELTNEQIADQLGGLDATKYSRDVLVGALTEARSLRDEGRSFTIMGGSDGTIDFAAMALEPQQMTNEQIAQELKVDGAGPDRGDLINAVITKRQITDELARGSDGNLHHHLAEVSVEDGQVTVTRGITLEEHFERMDAIDSVMEARATAPLAGRSGSWVERVDGALAGRVLE